LKTYLFTIAENMQENGVLTGCDLNQEWMLKWWWNHYTKQNAHPVAFCDFGMSKSARLWCEKNGIILFCPPLTLKTPSPTLKAKWTYLHTNEKRKPWFQKPQFFRQTPFQNTIWIDLDCEVRKNLTPLFTLLQNAPSGFVISEDLPRATQARKEKKILSEDQKAYMAGVVAFKKTSLLIQKWADACAEQNDQFYSDQDVLNHLLYKDPVPITLLESHFHFLPFEGCKQENDPMIYHHALLQGKLNILQTL